LRQCEASEGQSEQRASVGVNDFVVTKSARVLASIAAILLDTSRERGSIVLTSFLFLFSNGKEKEKTTIEFLNHN
jgi:hypothetical protein